MRQLAILLLGASVLVLLPVTPIAADPNVTFTPPDSFAVGTQFVARCTVDNFAPSDTITRFYSVFFYFTSADKKLNPYGTAIALAFYNVNYHPVDPDKIEFVTFAMVVDTFDVSTTEGDVKALPNFEVKINPKGKRAIGQYHCSLKTPNGREYKSNVWNGGLSAIPSVVLLTFLAIVALKFQ